MRTESRTSSLIGESRPLISIIILNWNGKGITVECLDSLKSITYPNYKVYVVDNGSTDDSVDEIMLRHPSVKLIKSERNLLYAGGNNFGWQYARFDNPKYILFLNNDTTVDKGFLEYLVDVIESDPSIGVVGPKIYYYEHPDLIWSAGGYIRFFWGGIGHYGLRQRDKGQFDRRGEVDYLTGCALLIRADLFDKLAGFDESYKIYGEDVDICYRATLLGYKNVYVPDSKVWHKISSSAGRLSLYKIHNKARSNFKFFSRYGRWYTWALMPLSLVYKGLSLLFLNLIEYVLSLLRRYILREVNRAERRQDFCGRYPI